MLIYLITHPMVTVDKKLPHNKWKISKEGWKQVRNLAKEKIWKDVQFIYASVEPKANCAAKYWSKKHKIPMKIVKNIEEIRRSRGNLPDWLPRKKLYEAVDAFYSNPDKRMLTWETANEMKRRMIGAMNKIINDAKKKRYKAIAVVSHGAVANQYVCSLKKIKASRKTEQKKIGSWIVIDADRKKVLTKWRAY